MEERMTIVSRTAAILVVGMACLGPMAPAVHADERHSGRVIGIDDRVGMILIEEVGPWQVKQGVTQVTRYTIVVTPSTKIVSHIRVNVRGRFGGDFIEVPLHLSDVARGDFVTVEGRRERGQLVASSIAVAELGPAIMP
jgi:hypothetical protein